MNEVRKGIGIVFQAFNLFPHMSRARERHAGAAEGAGLPRARAEEEALELLERFGLPRGATSTPTASRAASSSALRSSARWR